MRPSAKLSKTMVTKAKTMMAPAIDGPDFAGVPSGGSATGYSCVRIARSAPDGHRVTCAAIASADSCSN